MVDLEHEFTKEDHDRVSAAVAAAEAKTQAEIVPAVAAASGRYDRAEDIVGFWLAALVAVLLVSYGLFAEDESGWDAWPAWASITVLVVSMATAFTMGAIVSSRIGWLRRLLTPNGHMVEVVEGRAAQTFFDRRVHHTAEGSGLLLYLSLEEHMGLVCADKAVADALGDGGLQSLRTLLVDTVRTEGPTEALCVAIEEAGNRLAQALPREGDDRNELADALILLPAP